MTCTSQLLLSGLCTLTPSFHSGSFDVWRFGDPPEVQVAQYESRVEQAFAEELPIAGHKAVLASVNLALLPAIQFPEPKPKIKPKPEPKPLVTAYAAVEPEKPDPVTPIIKIKPEVREKPRARTGKKKDRVPSTQRKTFRFWPFKKKPKIPAGIDMNSKGYREVQKAALKHGVDVHFALLVAKQESRGNCNATSSANAKGVMQVIPGTARKHGLYRANNLYDCKVGADIGIRELKSCLQKSGGNRVQALVCYNAGPAWITSHRYKGRRIPAETRRYIKIITGKSVAKVT